MYDLYRLASESTIMVVAKLVKIGLPKLRRNGQLQITNEGMRNITNLIIGSHWPEVLYWLFGTCVPLPQ